MKTRNLKHMNKFSFLIAISLIVILFSGCEKGIFCTSGKGEIVSSTIAVSEFSEIEASGAFDVVVKQGESQNVEIVGHQNMIDKVRSHVINDRLEVDLERGCYNDYILTIYVTTPDVNKVILNGSGDIEIEEFDTLTNLELVLEGSGNIYGDRNFPINNLSFFIIGSGNIDFSATALNIVSEIEGSGNIKLAGTTNTHEAIINGSGSFKTFDLISEDTMINVLGSGNGYFYVNDNLKVNIIGSGNIYYKGNPTLEINIDGSGNIYNSN